MNQTQATQQDQTYGQIQTRDIFHAAYLVTQGMRITEILPDKTNNRSKAIFVIEGQRIAEYEEQYRNGTVLVNVFSLKESVQRVKDVMFDYLRTNGLA
ncbi:MAG: hypothetical protein CVU24_17905 [Betaproteobacteria bacterium HGW-Betaproteobacteria-18]|nr:MAG: hypothetical protein CVU24_17905 [Betaproteobacteria bacterium HGW-Betaproteobacteria-18]